MSTQELPDPSSLELLLLVERHGSIGRAATQHGISQAAASRRLDTLEKHLGLVLMSRTPMGTRLTPHGQLVVDWARPVLAACEEFTTNIDALRERRDAKLRVAASLTIAEYLVPRWLAGLRSASPDIDVALRLANSSAVVGLVANGEADLGFIESSEPVLSLGYEEIGHDRLIVVVSPRHPWADLDRPLALGDLLESRLIVREAGSGTRAFLETALLPHTVGPPALELTSNAAVKVAVESGLGPAVLSLLAVDAELRQGRLVGAPIADLDLRRPLRAVWKGAPSRAAAALLAVARTTTDFSGAEEHLES